MYEEAQVKTQYDGQRNTVGLIESRPKTMRENIDRQITQAEAHVARLRDLKSKLESGVSLLDLDMNDLRQGMNY